MPCPVDSTHSVAVGQLQAHVRVCTRAREAAAIAAAPYVSAECNCGSDSESGDTTARLADVGALWRLMPDDSAAFQEALSEVRCVPKLHCETECRRDCARVTGAARRAVVDKVMEASASLPPENALASIPECVRDAVQRLEQQALEAHATEPWDEKHIHQQAGIVGALHRHGLLEHSSSAVYADLGAGRGYLLHLLAQTCGPPVKLLNVERRSYRKKAERTLRRMDGVHVVRARCDVSDLDLATAVTTLFPEDSVDVTPRPLVVVAKHLCGGATDMALRSALRCSTREGIILAGVCLAPCCHHSCTWRSYVNKNFLRGIGIGGRREFGIMCRLASWCVDGHGGTRPNVCADTMSRWGYTPAERAHVGASVKRLLDAGRAKWLAAQCGEACLQTYVDAAVTPENRLVIWVPSTSPSAAPGAARC